MAYCFRDSTLVVQVLAQTPDDLELLLHRQTVDGDLNYISDARLEHRDEAVVVHVREEAHDELAVHAVSDATVTRDRLAKVLDLESTLETGGEEAAKGSDKRSECGENQNVELDRLNMEGLVHAGPLRDMVRLGHEGRVGRALKTRQDVGTQIIDGADEVLVAHQDVGHEVAEDDGANPRAKEPFDSLLGGQLDKLGATEGNTADVGKDIVRDDERGGKEEPDHALQDVVHDKVSLNDDQVERHMRPSELGKLEPVLSFLQGRDEEDEA